MGISRQAYYKRCQAEVRRGAQAEVVTTLVRDLRLRQPRLGTRKLHHLLAPVLGECGIKLGRDRLFDVLRAARRLVVPPRAYHKTTHSHHRFRRHPNLLKAGPAQVVPQAPEQVWVADITYLPTAGPFVYLSLVTDAFSRKIVGYHVHDSVQAEQRSRGPCARVAVAPRLSTIPIAAFNIAQPITRRFTGVTACAAR